MPHSAILDHIDLSDDYLLIKGYLCHKTITSQNVSSEEQVKNFLYCRKVTFPSQDIKIFIFLTVQ